MKKANKKLLSYYVYFKSIKNHEKKTVAKIKGNTIISRDKSFLMTVSSGSYGIPMDEGLKYNIYDQEQNKVIAKVDKHFNTYTLNNKYSGSLYDSTKVLKTVVGCIILALVTLCLVFAMLPRSGSSVKPKELVISETDGGIVTKDWNIFGRYKPDKVIYPGKSGEYYFELINNNSKSVSVILNFDEVNEHDVPMVYRLSNQAGYIKGDNNTYLDISQINTDGITIPANSSVVLRLDWYWKEVINGDKKDTEIGMTGSSGYTIKVEVISILNGE